MESTMKKPHAICIPVPAQGHINPMLKLAKLLHSKGFHITFVHTEFNYNRIVKSRGQDSLKGLDDFRFATISDGLPSTNQRGILDLPALCTTISVDGLCSLHDLITKLNNASSDVPPVSCIVSDGVMGFTLKAAQEFGIPEVMLFTPSGCGTLGYLHYEDLKERGYFPLKDEDCLSNGYLDTAIDWIPEMRGIRLKDLPTFLRSTDENDIMFNYSIESVNNAVNARAIVLNTFDDLEEEVLEAIKIKYPNLYTIGPLSMLNQQLPETKQETVESNLWKEDNDCLSWLDKREPNSVVYVNFGSLIIMTSDQLSEFAWGLANSMYSFLWIIRSNLVDGGVEILSREFMEETKERGFLSDWCPQERVLSHHSIGGFLTHCGWNSTLESICGGVPLICWPFFADQQTNCFYSCNKWGIGMEIDTDVKRDKVEGLVRELMEGEKGKEIREKVMEWKKRAQAATKSGGSSYTNFVSLVRKLKELTDIDFDNVI